MYLKMKHLYFVFQILKTKVHSVKNFHSVNTFLPFNRFAGAFNLRYTFSLQVTGFRCRSFLFFLVGVKCEHMWMLMNYFSQKKPITYHIFTTGATVQACRKFNPKLIDHCRLCSSSRPLIDCISAVVIYICNSAGFQPIHISAIRQQSLDSISSVEC